MPAPRPALLPELGLEAEDGLEVADHEARDARVLSALDTLLVR